MCTLVFARDLPVAGAILIGANRDEDPGRPSDPPGVLQARPRVVGGRDRVAGGTWLAVREERAVVAMLNRRSDAPHPADPRSRGLLALDVAAADGGPDFAARALETAREALEHAHYAPFSLAYLSPPECWILVHDGRGRDTVLRPGPGWHVLTHSDLDDLREPRTARLRNELAEWRPPDWEAARSGLVACLALHDPDPARTACIHDGPVATVSAAILQLGAGEPRYLHAEGRPCQRPFEDHVHLITRGAAAPEAPR